jgi:apolipoprotein N-acyltransferase
LWPKLSGKDSFLCGWAAGFGFHGLSFYWIYSTCRFADIPIPVALLAWSALCAFFALKWALIAATGRWILRKHNLAAPWIWACGWAGWSAAWEHGTLRPPVDLLAFTQYTHLSLLQANSIFGPYGLGFVIVAFNASLAGFFSAPKKAAWLNFCAAAALVLAWGGWGIASLRTRQTEGPTAGVQILQPNVDQYQKLDSTSAHAILDNFNELLSRPSSENPALIVWPESSLPFWVMESGDVHFASQWSRRLKAWQAVGVVSQNGGSDYNSAFLLDPDGKIQGVYHKRQLVPFGEYIPAAFGWTRRLVGYLDQMGNLTPGVDDQPLWPTIWGKAGATICYEAVFPGWARADAQRGARIILNVTNDGWYKDTWGPYQHFGTNVFRAIESRVTVIRAANTGISAVIDPWGIATAKLDLNTRGRLDAEIPLKDPFPNRSFYARHGDWFGFLNLFALMGLTLSAV